MNSSKLITEKLKDVNWNFFTEKKCKVSNKYLINIKRETWHDTNTWITFINNESQREKKHIL